MKEPVDGFELLDRLREENEKKTYAFRELKHFLSIKARTKGIPVSGEFELTPLCNFNCKMCYVHLEADQLKGQSVLPVDVWKNLIFQAWKAGMITATLTGGECLTYPGFDELYLYLQSLGCQVSVLTNGFLLDENRIRFFSNHPPAMIQITLYGWNDDTYERVTGQRAFTTVVNNYKRAVHANLPVYFTLTPNTYLGDDLFETIRVAKELCDAPMINSFYIPPREETGRSDQQDAGIDLYIRAYQYLNHLEGRETVTIAEDKLPVCCGPYHESSECGLRCGGGRSSFMINWKGILMPCAEMDMIRANTLKDGFASAWSKINQEANSWPRVPECKDCAYDSVCNNCAANMLHFADPGKVPTGLCKQTREWVRNGVKTLPECD